MSNRDKWVSEGGVFQSTYKGKDWSLLNNNAWTDFPWGDLSSEEKKYIKTIWNQYTSGSIWPMSAIKDNAVKADTGKFLFLDAFNLAPTLGEYHGLSFGIKKQIPTGKPFYTNFKSALEITVNKVNKGYIYASNVGMSNKDEYKYFGGDVGKLDSVRYNGKAPIQYKVDMVNDKDIEWTDYRYPAEDEFKLSWMRQLVQYGGIEWRMGPFNAKLDKTKKPIHDGNNFRINIGNIDHLLQYRSSYKEAYFYNWAQNELDWANGVGKNNFGFNENHSDYNKSLFPRAPIPYLRNILNKTLISPAGQPIEDIILAIGVSGRTRTNGSSVNDKYWDTIEDLPVGGSRPYPATHILTKGVLPYFANEEDKKNYIVSGWVELPFLMTRPKKYLPDGTIEEESIIINKNPIRLPWPFVWAYVGINGFYKTKQSSAATVLPPIPDGDIIDLFYNNNTLPSDFIKINTKIGGDNSFRYNWRSRLWHYRYDTFEIPDRELLFYLRMKYGISRSTGFRYLTPSIEIEEIFDVLVKEGVQFTIGNTAKIGTAIAWAIFQVGSLISTGRTAEDIWSYPGLDLDISLVKRIYKIVFDKYHTWDKPRLIDSLVGGGLIGKNEYKSLFGKEITDEYGTFPYPIEYRDGNTEIPYLLRSRYVSAVQDVIGFQRFNTDSDHSFKKADIKTSRKLTGQNNEYEVVDYKNYTGYYTFNGHGADRFVWSGRNMSYLDYKKSRTSDIKKNDLCLNKLLTPPLKESKDIRDNNDRYVSPENLQSYEYDETKRKFSKIKKDASKGTSPIYYYNHSITPRVEGKPLSVKNEFHPGLLSPKEIQFMYEMVTCVLYKNTEASKHRESEIGAAVRAGAPIRRASCYWDPISSEDDRWSELGYRINMPLYDLDKSYTKYGFPYENTDIKVGSTSCLADYILWAAPTKDQFEKKKFSKYENTFVSLSSELAEGYAGNKNNAYKTIPYSEIEYPMTVLAKKIIKSESSERPIVPAFVHHRYISRKMNNTGSKDEYDAGFIKSEAFGINTNIYHSAPTLSGEKFTDINVYPDILRALGGIDKYDYGTAGAEKNGIDKGVLIVLPTFVLGGRVDLKESGTWDNSWGECPFQLSVEGELVVGNLDKVLDMWARHKKHNGKYVSAMEIAFWIRYKHGLAATPTEKRVVHKVGALGEKYNPGARDINPFPYFLKDFYVFPASNAGIDYLFPEDSRKKLSMMDNETLDYIPIVTSYYNPILVDFYDDISKDPLIEVNTAGRSYLSDPSWERAAYTGFNSYYACDWPGAVPVKGIRVSEPIASAVLEILGGSFDLKQGTHCEHYLHVHRQYRGLEEIIKNYNNIGYLKTGAVYTGFGYETNDENCIRVLLASDIQAWFKSCRLLGEVDKFSEYINNGMLKKEGEKGSVLEVQGRVVEDHGGKSSSESEGGDLAHFYISGEGIGSRQTSFRAKDSNPLSFEEQMRVRPWFDRFESSAGNIQEELVALCDDYSRGSVGCIPNYFYMRHLLIPDYFMYVSSNVENSSGGFYNTIQLDKIKKAFHNASQIWSKTGIELGTYNGESSNLDETSRLRGLALQAITLGTISTHWKYDDSYVKDISKNTRLMAFTAYWTKYTQQKAVWNTSQKALMSTMVGLSKVSHFDVDLLKGLSYTAEQLKESQEILKSANDALHHMNGFRSALSNISKIYPAIKFGKEAIRYTKYFLDIYNSGVLGNVVPSGLPIFGKSGKKTVITIDLGNGKTKKIDLETFYKQIKPHLIFGKEYVLGKVEQAVVNKVVGKLYQSSVTELAAFGAENASADIIGSAAFGTTVLAGVEVIAIALVVFLVSHSIDRLLEKLELESQIKGMWDIINEANQKGFLEGPYLQSDRTVQIKKTETGKIPILGKTYSKESENNTEPTSTGFKLLNLENMNEATLIDHIKKQNENFYKEGGLLDKILGDIKEDSCECKFFDSIFYDSEKLPPNHAMKKNLSKELSDGPWLRTLLNRSNIVDEAPIYSDIPMVYQAASRPYADVAYWPDPSSNQGAGPQEKETNIRRQGNNGTFIADSNNKDCSRFWWPTLAVTPSLNLCDYMPLGGKYPSAPADYNENCEKFLIEKIYRERGSTKSVYLVSNDSEFKDMYGNPDRPADGFNYNYSRKQRSQKALSKIEYYEINEFISGAWVANTSTFKPLNGRTYTPTRFQAADHLYYINDGTLRGNGVYTEQGVHGPAPPHEREIINIFRKKYNIDTVLPAYWKNNNKGSNSVFNTYKDDRPLNGGYTFTRTNCCSMGEIAQDSNQIDSIASKKKNNTFYCEYVITLNTKTFKEKIKNKCRKKDTTDNTNESKSNFTNELPTPNWNPPPIKYVDVLPIGVDGNKDPKTPPPPTQYPNPRIVGCTNCPPERPLVVSEDQIKKDESIRSMIKPGSYSNAYYDWNVNVDLAFFNMISFEWVNNIDWPWGNGNTEQWRETRSTPLQPGKKVRV